jgi:hypothetical protein
MPPTFANVSGSRIHTAATSAAKSGESALRIAAVEASMVVSACAMSTNGMSRPITATKRYARQRRVQSIEPPLARSSAKSASPAISTRAAMSAIEPKYGTA